MAEPRSGACAPWATAADVCSPCDDYAFDAALLDNALQAASDILFELSGRQFPGSCEATVRPCARQKRTDTFPDRTVSGSGRAVWSGGYCACQRGDACGCSRLSAVLLGGWPVNSITEVKVDGVVLDPARYRIDDYRWLVRLEDADGTNPGWPCCQDMSLDATQDDTFEVTFSYGRTPPQAGVSAAAELGCQLALACQPETVGQCQLPRRVTTVVRQGLTLAVIDPMDFLEEGKTGLYSVDLFLRAYNPAGIRRRGRFASIDGRSPVTRVDT